MQESPQQRAEAQHAVTQWQTYDSVAVITDRSTPYWLEGTYRARIVSDTNYYFDPRGSAIWITTTGGMEAFVPIDSIRAATLVKPYSA